MHKGIKMFLTEIAMFVVGGLVLFTAVSGTIGLFVKN